MPHDPFGLSSGARSQSSPFGWMLRDPMEMHVADELRQLVQVAERASREAGAFLLAARGRALAGTAGLALELTGSSNAGGASVGAGIDSVMVNATASPFHSCEVYSSLEEFCLQLICAFRSGLS